MDSPLKNCRHSGFTLVEVLTTIGIVAVLAALLWPALKSQIPRAQSVRCINNLRQLYTGILNYAADNRMELPCDRANAATAASWHSPIMKYLPHPGHKKKRDPYFCPANPSPHESGASGYTNYAYNSNLILATPPQASGETDEEHRAKRQAWRLSQLDKAYALLIDCAMPRDDGTFMTDYATQGARYGPPRTWRTIHAVHSGRVNVLFTDGHVESPKVEPRPNSLGVGQDLVECKAAWFWPISQ